MRLVMREFNSPGLAVGIVAGDRLVFARGYGLRDPAHKLPFTPDTLFAMGSNTKLFTAIAAGMLVDAGTLSYDRPIRGNVPSIEFFNATLNDAISLRDMLSHRTGISRHDSIWFNSNYTSQELFDKIRFLEPVAPLRSQFLYNNLMYAAVGRIIEIKSGQTYAEFIRRRLLLPLDMKATQLTVAGLRDAPNHAVPVLEDRKTHQLQEIAYFHDFAGLAAAGALVSNVNDLSHWVVALMNEGQFEGRQVIPKAVLRATMEAAIAVPPAEAGNPLDRERLNAYYGMGRFVAVFHGHLLTYHGGHIDGYRSQISMLPDEKIGVIVLVGGDHTEALYDAISFDIYERLLGLPPASWDRELLDFQLSRRAARDGEAATPSQGRVSGKPPSHVLTAFVGEFENAAYGTLKISLNGSQLQYRLHDTQAPLKHIHYDRFDTPQDPFDGSRSVNFITGLSGAIDKATVSLDDAEVTFTRCSAPCAPHSP